MERENTSGWKPKGRAVLLKPFEKEKPSSLIELPDQVLRNQHMLNQCATVIAVGAGAWADEKEPRAAIGDNVIYTRFAGFYLAGDMTADGEAYRVVNDNDIFMTESNRG